MKKDVLSHISFGVQIAEDETNDIAKYFVETDQWRKLFNGEIDVIYGPKGAGKSALYSLLLQKKDELSDRGIYVSEAENPRGATVFKDLEVEPPASEIEFIGLWKLYIVCILQDIHAQYGIDNTASAQLREYLVEAGLIKGNSSLKALLKRVRDYISQFKNISSLEGGLSISPTNGTPTFSGKIIFQEPTAKQALQDLNSVDHLLSLANSALSGAGKKAWILLDRLDVAFQENEALEMNALRALFRTYLDMKEYDFVALKIFLRTDIWRRISDAGFREASHITKTVTIKWTENSLLNLIVRRSISNEAVRKYFRIDESLGKSTPAAQKQFLYRMLPEQVEVGSKKPETFKWILTRTRDGTMESAPREIIHFMNSLRSEELARLENGEVEPEGEMIFSRQSFKAALPVVSKVRLEQTLYSEFPKLKKYIENLKGEKAEQTIDSLMSIWNLREDQASKVAGDLVQIGFFEDRTAQHKASYWVPFMYRPALDMVQGVADSE